MTNREWLVGALVCLGFVLWLALANLVVGIIK